MNNSLTNLVNGLKQELERAVAEIKSDQKMSKIFSLHQALNTLEESCGASKTDLADLFAFRSSATTRPDEFYGVEPLEAAKRFLRKKGMAAAFAEILSAIRSGGCEVGDEEELRVSLGRSTRQVAKIGTDLYGLVEFYPDLRRGRPRTFKEGVEAVANGRDVVQVADELTEKADGSKPE
jgi:hypothetical protein